MVIVQKFLPLSSAIEQERSVFDRSMQLSLAEKENKFTSN